MSSTSLTLRALDGIPLVEAGDDLAAIVLDGLAASGERLAAGDVIVLAQKIVSKAEGRLVALADVEPGAAAHELAVTVDKDPRLAQLVLDEAEEVLRARPGVVIVRTRGGVVAANAGIDQSNVGGVERALLLPVDADASAAALRSELRSRTGVDVAVVIIDSVGRAWRNGTVGLALGVSGMPGLLDLRSRPDLFGRPLQTTEIGLADEVAAAASLVMGQGNEGRPVVLARGVPYDRREGNARELLRPRHMDMFL